MCFKEESELDTQQKRAVDLIALAAAEDDRIARHDRRLAVLISQMSAAKWRESGDLVEDPIPTIPQSDRTISSASNGNEDSPHIKSLIVRPSSAGTCNPASSSTPRNVICKSAGETVACLICFDEVSPSAMISALRDVQEPSSSNADASCSHFYCISCMRQYARGEVQGHKYPIKCPTMGCKMKLQINELHMLLDDDLQQLAVSGDAHNLLKHALKHNM
jgi:hypothetical protein